MSNYSLSDCLTFGLVLLFLLGALVAGPATLHTNTYDIYHQLRDQILLNKQGVIEQFTEPGKVLGNVNPNLIYLYNKL